MIMGAIDSQNVNRDVITNNDLKRYKNILEMTNVNF